MHKTTITVITTTDVAADAVADVVSVVVAVVAVDADADAVLKEEATEAMKPTACLKPVIGNYA